MSTIAASRMVLAHENSQYLTYTGASAVATTGVFTKQIHTKEIAMRSDLTDVVVIVDRSGSMCSCRDDAEGGLNTFVEEQKKHPGDCNLTLVQFDTECEFVHRGVPIKDVPKFTLVTRGLTALLDAVGKAIAETGERLSKLDESQRPGLVVVVIITDGQENASKEYRRDQIKQMIEHQTTVYNWQFTFLGANQDAFEEASSIGIDAQQVGLYHKDKTSQAFGSASSNVTRMRTASASGASVDNSYTEEELKSMN